MSRRMSQRRLNEAIDAHMSEVNRAYARRSDVETSHEAAASIPSLVITEQKARILSLLAVRGPMTDQDIKRHYEQSWLPPTEQSLRSRRSELVRDGLVAFSGDYGHTRTGKRSRKWHVTPKGRRCL